MEFEGYGLKGSFCKWGALGVGSGQGFLVRWPSWR